MPKKNLIALLLFALAACGGDSTDRSAGEEPGADAGSPTVTEGTFQTDDGLTIAYDTRGQGDTTLLFVHCWACDRTFWREQLDVFASDYRVVSLDLAGHGESGAERSEWTLQGLASDVAGLVRELDLDRVILVGHSMGGPVSLLAAAQLPQRVIAVVGVDNLHNAEFTWPPEALEQIVGQFEADFGGAMGQMVPGMFPQGGDPQLMQWIIERASTSPVEPALALMRDFANFDYKEAFSAVKVPVRCINAVPWQAQGGMQTAVEVNRKYADFDVVLMQGVGHYLLLERPAEFNAHLRQVVGDLQ